MSSLTKSSIVAFLFAAQCVLGLGLPELAKRATTCNPTIYTTQHITTITIESIVTAPHSCFAFTAETPQATGCPTIHCEAIPACAVEEKTTFYVPPSDTCCPMTTTTTIQGPCPTCQTGCATFWETVLITTSPVATAMKRGISSPASTPSSSSTPCTQTIFRAEPFVEGPTKTMYPYTVTQTYLEDCGGCEYLDVKNLAGLGPAVIFTTTTFEHTPATTTAYACSSTPVH